MNSSSREWTDCPGHLFSCQYIVKYLGWQKMLALGNILVLLQAQQSTRREGVPRQHVVY